MKNTTLINYIKIFAAIFFWASLYHIIKIPLEQIDPYFIGFIRYLLASVILIFFHKKYTGEILPKLNTKQWIYVFAVGFFGLFCYNIAFFEAEKRVSGNIVAVIFAFTPCVIAIVSSYIFKSKIATLGKIGIIIAFIGTIGVVGACNTNQCSTEFFHISTGELLSIMTVVFFTILTIFSKFATNNGVKSLTINTYATVVCMIFFTIVSLFSTDFSKVSNLSISFWVSMVYIAFFSTVLAYLWFIDSIVAIGVYKTAVFQNTLPFLVIAIGFVFFGEEVSAWVILFGILIFAGVFITNLSNKK